MNELGAITLDANILNKANIGLWAFEIENDKPPRMYVDNTMLKLLGLKKQISPEQTYHAWYDNVDKEHYTQVNDAVAKMKAGVPAEVQYPWHCPDGTIKIIRCGGVINPSYKEGIRIEGTHQDVTDIVHFQDKQTEDLIQKKLEDDLRTIEGIASEYDVLHIIDLATDNYTSYFMTKYSTEDSKKIRQENQNYFEAQKVALKFFCHPDHLQEMMKYTEKNVLLDTVITKKKFSTRFLCKLDNQYRWSEFVVIKFDPIDSFPTRIAVGYIDIDDDVKLEMTRQTELQNALRTADIFQKAAFITACCYFLADITDNKITSDLYEIEDQQAIRVTDSFDEKTRSSYSNIVQYSAKNLIKSNVEEYLKEMSPEKIIEDYNKGITQKDFYCWVNTIKKSNRCQKFILYLSKDKDTEHIMLTCIAYDVTNQIQIEEENNKRISNVMSLAESFEAIYDVNLDTGEYKLYSEKTLFSEELVPQLVNGKDIFKDMYNDVKKIVYKDDRHLFYDYFTKEYISKTLQEKPEVAYEYRLIIKGVPEWYYLKIVKPNNSNKNKIIVGIFNINERRLKEITQQEALKESLALAQAANKAKTSFLNNMSHDIRTPLNAIIGFSELAKKHYDEKEVLKEYLEKINQSSNHLLELINDVLDMSRIEAGKIAIHDKDENILNIINELQTIILPEAKSKNITFNVELKNIINPEVICDRLKIKQVLLNVLSNAVKYTPEGGKVIFTVLGKDNNDSDYVDFEFVVKDTGIGMTEEFLSTIYEPFTRASSSTISGIQGTGLGMAISKNIIDLVGGTIEIKSKPKEGTQVNLNFGFKISKKSQKSAHKSAKIDYSFENKKILIVEDNAFNMEIAVSVLQETGAIIDTAINGQIAVEKVRKSKPGEIDLILMDVQMPVMNGYEATKNIRALRNKKLSNIPIIAMTANAFDEDRKLALNCGMNEYIAKPINVDKLKEIISLCI